MVSNRRANSTFIQDHGPAVASLAKGSCFKSYRHVSQAGRWRRNMINSAHKLEKIHGTPKRLCLALIGEPFALCLRFSLRVPSSMLDTERHLYGRVKKRDYPSPFARLEPNILCNLAKSFANTRGPGGALQSGVAFITHRWRGK